ncbi:MAG: inorganic phosphate transporter [Chloroflexia bacterium]|nr:inorganic phosphate transporter [Chloroflexia bacterium]
MPLSGNDIAFLVLLVVALVYDFLNGFHDSGNIVSTMVVSGAMEPGPALWLAALGEFAGPFLFGVAVATTIGADLVDPQAITVLTIAAALLGAIAWNVFTWVLRLPSSSSHALVGGILGAVAVSTGLDSIQQAGLQKVLLALLLSPLVGLGVSYLLLRLVRGLAWLFGATPRINRFFRWAQIPASLALALSHGTNDGQKTMGVITMGLVAAGWQQEFLVPTWVIALSAVTIALGTLSGGMRIARTLGTRIYRIRPLHGFSAQVTATSTILVAALLGGPVSTTQVVSSAITGAGAAERLSKVRWGVFGEILLTWLLTIPAAALVSAACWFLLKAVGLN